MKADTVNDVQHDAADTERLCSTCEDAKTKNRCRLCGAPICDACVKRGLGRCME